LADGNLHLSVSVPGFGNKEMISKVSKILHPWVYEEVTKAKGSLSAQYGIGQKNKHAINYSKTPEMIEWMKNVKNLFDPKGILNPYKLF